MPYNNDERKQQDSVYSKRVRAGKRRTYFFDVRETRSSDYFLTITESRKRFDDNGYDRHKIFLYKEDFNKFQKALGEALDHVRTELMPDFDFDAFNHEYPEGENGYTPGEGEATQTSFAKEPGEERVELVIAQKQEAPAAPAAPSINQDDTNNNDDHSKEEVDKW